MMLTPFRSFFTTILVVLVLLSVPFTLSGQGNSGGNGKPGGPPLWELSGNSTSSGDFLGTTNSMPLILKTDGTEHLRLLPNGNVGIGTSAPLRSLDVAGDALVRQTLYVQNGMEIGGVLRPHSGDSTIDMDGEARMMDGACVMNGRFGIGTGSPSERLTVQGDARIHGRTNTDSLKVNGKTEFGYATFDSLKVGDSSVWIGGIGPKGSSKNNVIRANNNGDLQLQKEETPSQNHIGNVGISTSSPEKKLHVKAVHKSSIQDPTEDPYLGDHAGIMLENVVELNGTVSNAKWKITPRVKSGGDSKLDIGKVGGATPLIIKDNGLVEVHDRIELGGFLQNGQLKILSNNSGVNHTVNAEDNLNGVSGVMQINAEDGTTGNSTGGVAMTVNDDADKSLFLREDGKVGIGTSQPQERLDIEGSSAKL